MVEYLAQDSFPDIVCFGKALNSRILSLGSDFGNRRTIRYWFQANMVRPGSSIMGILLQDILLHVVAFGETGRL